MKAMLGFIATGLAAYIALVAIMYLTQSRQVYFPTSALVTDPAAHGMAYEDVWLGTSDEVRLHGWFVPADEPRGTLLFLHGNAGNISHRIDSIRIFRELGLSVLIIDYRGYGQSEGAPTEAGTYRDAEAALAYLRSERGIAADEVVVFGRSLGSAIAARLAATETVGALILESAFTRAVDLAADLMPWLPVRWILRFEYDTLDAVKSIHVPLLVIHSVGDEIVPFHHGRRIFETANEPKRFLEIQGGHNDGFLRSKAAYIEGLSAFLAMPRQALPE